ncbi:MAG: succinate dehydrogenase/fumarate reductase iron-sulfur subunit [Pseudomonadales bacterium]|jgi:fumarate reductase iron-sulfur subunit|nr:succinate dehydrogenase/fumarate reductase iron-sulfur subunit [Pseudomonadales bacterium]MDP7145810.1 succinate dehydrogenase/fumarate reductase iron-sulfur subunit [Pseudomonadales bacterium]MDP7356810.1 succinate dehydrogenase/fumarate reductase iron-sulfur subunit [Pseudomonadales bacterium]HJN53370.1 succinate dehydrogenase/fumarate reductase iron-sulfur subunit [Pseudomonadales bacterium]
MPELTIDIEVLRYRPETDDEPSYQTYTVPYQDDWSVLDALNHIKDHMDGSISYRWSCHMAVCGSCGMMIDDVPHLSCKTFLRDYYPNKVKLDPLANFPIERDLVVNIEGFLEKLESVKPYLIHAPDDPLNETEYLETPAELIRFKQYTMCINCLLCYSACPEFALDPDFTGPAALTLAHRYNVDARDQGTAERTRIMNTEKGVWPCMFVGACSEVCPKQVDPAAAVQQIKVASVFDWYKSLLPFQDGE